MDYRAWCIALTGGVLRPRAFSSDLDEPSAGRLRERSSVGDADCAVGVCTGLALEIGSAASHVRVPRCRWGAVSPSSIRKMRYTAFTFAVATALMPSVASAFDIPPRILGLPLFQSSAVSAGSNAAHRRVQSAILRDAIPQIIRASVWAMLLIALAMRVTYDASWPHVWLAVLWTIGQMTRRCSTPSGTWTTSAISAAQITSVRSG
jgi:hypothetical protein